MDRWVFAVLAVMAAQVGVCRVDAAEAIGPAVLGRLAVVRNADGVTGRQAPVLGERHAQARTCKAVSSCEEAVRLWCGGYRRADGDNDGIPCENVCSSVSEVDEIKVEIGC